MTKGSKNCANTTNCALNILYNYFKIDENILKKSCFPVIIFVIR